MRSLSLLTNVVAKMYRLKFSSAKNACDQYVQESKEKWGDDYNLITDRLKTVSALIDSSTNLNKSQKKPYKKYISILQTNVKSLPLLSFDYIKDVVNKKTDRNNPLNGIIGCSIDSTQKFIYNEEGVRKSFVFHEKIVWALRYDDARDMLRKSFKTMKIKSCIYCNAQYLSTYNVKTKMASNAQMDHFFDKSDYPCLAISFYNFQPCCAYCNQKKSTKEMSFYLYTQSGVQNPFYFHLDSGELSKYLLHEENNLSLSFKYVSSRFKDMHKDLNDCIDVQDLFNGAFLDTTKKFIITVLINSDELKNGLNNGFEELKKEMNMDDLETRFNFISNPERIHEEPLTKLKQDVYKQLLDEGRI